MGQDTPREAFCVAALGLFARFALTASEAVAQGDAKAGAEVYVVQKCARCHGEDGKGKGPTAIKLKVTIADWTDKAAMSQMTDESLVEIITKGGKALGKSAKMPSYAEKLNEAQVKDLVAFMRSLAP